MDEAGIRTAVLSMPAPQPWWGDGAESQRICQQYKQGTLHMVKSLDLVDMNPMNADGMLNIFRKIR